MNDSNEMCKVFIESQFIKQTIDIFEHTTDVDDDILPGLMKLMSIVTDRIVQFNEIIDYRLIVDFIDKSLFRLTDFRVQNSQKHDFYVFIDFIGLSKDNLYYLIKKLLESRFIVIFSYIENFKKENIRNILIVLNEFFWIFKQNDYDPSILSNLINLPELHQLFQYIDTLNIDDNLFDSKLVFIFFNFTTLFFNFCTDTIDDFFDKDIYQIFLKYLTHGSYKIRFSTFKTLENMISVNDSNKQVLIQRITSDFFISLIDFLDSESPEIVESILKFILDLFQNEDKRYSMKVTMMMRMANNSFNNIDEMIIENEQTETAIAYCTEIMKYNYFDPLYVDVFEFEEEDKKDSDLEDYPEDEFNTVPYF